MEFFSSLAQAGSVCFLGWVVYKLIKGDIPFGHNVNYPSGKYTSEYPQLNRYDINSFYKTPSTSTNAKPKTNIHGISDLPKPVRK
jgi:hypothetical protein